MTSNSIQSKPRAMRILLMATILVATLISANQLHGQNVSGTVYDAHNGEAVIGATLYDAATGKGYVTNSYGYFSIPTKNDSIKLAINHIGYESAIIALKNNQSNVSILLNPMSTEIDEVVVTRSGNTRARAHGQISLSSLDLKKAPVLMAEKDVLKTIQLLPGVQQNSEGTSNFSVRGGGHDQNLMLIDGIPVYNINHLWGFVSVFNTEAVNNVSFYKGGIPASYGGRLSSVVDVMLREGNYERMAGSVSVGLLSSRFTFEGPIQKGKSSFLLAGRRTVYDLIVTPILYAVHNSLPGYYFQDYTLKLNYKLSPHNTVYLSAYTGNDKAYLINLDKDEAEGLRFKDKFSLGWTNITTVARWNNTSVKNVFSNVTVAYTYFNYFNSFSSSIKDLHTKKKQVDYQGYYSGISDLIAKWNVSYYGFKNQQVNTGIDHTFHSFNPGISGNSYETDEDDEAEYNIVRGESTGGREMNAFIEDKFQLGRFSGNLGLRYSIFWVSGKSYTGLQPRVSLELKASESVSLFAGYNRMFQHIHLVSNSNLGMPTDLWLPISDKIPPQQSDQVSAGAKFKAKNGIQLTLEAYIKEMQNLTDYRDGVVLQNQTTSWEQVLLLGKGKSYGIEMLVEFSRSKLSGWLSYSLSKSSRTFSEIKNGQEFPFQYDRRHVANLFVSYSFTPSKTFSASWVATSGHWMTMSQRNYVVNGQVILDLSNRNNFQLSPFHHLDVTYTSSKVKKRGVRSWSFGVYNVYAHHNTFVIARRERNTNEYKPNNLYSICLFPFIPFVAWEYVFK